MKDEFKERYEELKKLSRQSQFIAQCKDIERKREFDRLYKKLKGEQEND